MHRTLKEALGMVMRECNDCYEFFTDYFDVVYYVMNTAHVGLLLCARDTGGSSRETSSVWDEVKSLMGRMVGHAKKLDFERRSLIESVDDTFKVIHREILGKGDEGMNGDRCTYFNSVCILPLRSEM